MGLNPSKCYQMKESGLKLSGGTCRIWDGGGGIQGEEQNTLAGWPRGGLAWGLSRQQGVYPRLGPQPQDPERPWDLAPVVPTGETGLIP